LQTIKKNKILKLWINDLNEMNVYFSDHPWTLFDNIPNGGENAISFAVGRGDQAKRKRNDGVQREQGGR